MVFFVVQLSVENGGINTFFRDTAVYAWFLVYLFND